MGGKKGREEVQAVEVEEEGAESRARVLARIPRGLARQALTLLLLPTTATRTLLLLLLLLVMRIAVATTCCWNPRTLMRNPVNHEVNLVNNNKKRNQIRSMH
jgi:hypothetical protein